MNERVSIGNATSAPRESLIGYAASAWRQHPELRTHELHQRLLSLWAQAEVARLAGERLRQQIAAGEPGPEGSAAKLTFARLNQEISGFEIELLGADGLTYDDWSMRRVRVKRLDPQRRLPLPAREGQLHRGRHVGGPPQHHRRARPAPPARAAHGHERPVEGPAPLMSADLLYSETERDLAAALSGLLADRAAPADVIARTERTEAYDLKLWRTVAAEIGVAGLLIPEALGGAGASYRELAAAAEQFGAFAAPIPYLGSAAVATAALLSAARSGRRR